MFKNFCKRKTIVWKQINAIVKSDNQLKVIIQKKYPSTRYNYFNYYYLFSCDLILFIIMSLNSLSESYFTSQKKREHTEPIKF